jgi:hypothetical protein
MSTCEIRKRSTNREVHIDGGPWLRGVKYSLCTPMPRFLGDFVCEQGQCIGIAMSGNPREMEMFPSHLRVKHGSVVASMKLALPVGMRPMIRDARATMITSALLTSASLFRRKCPVSELDDSDGWIFCLHSRSIGRDAALKRVRFADTHKKD